ncbi:MAG TPA: hydrogenase maturation nickel metallochaperone HypA [Myxococcota bacterium]|nr:hydrogenase maturation nickel metallochaperone HypA [Myxococcota bacterium]
MHEASLCDALFDQVDAAIARHPNAANLTVREIQVTLGELAGVDPELFQIAFDTLRLDRHPAATLTLTHVPARWRCPTCANTHTPNTALTCPDCDLPLALESGGDLTLQRIELTLSPDPEVPHV